GHHRHGNLGASARDPAPHRPCLASICTGRSSRLRPPLPRALEAGPRALDRIRAVAEPDRRDAPARYSAVAGERPHVRGLLSALEPRARADPPAATGLRSLLDAGRDPSGTVRAIGRTTGDDGGRSQIRRGAVTGR